MTKPRGCSKLWSVGVESAQETGHARKSRIPDLSNRTWVTRKGIKVDRIASAWLIRRFIDAGARFRFIDPKRETARPGEITFDMVGGDFTHEADHCTFETLASRAGIKDAALADRLRRSSTRST